MSKFKIGDRVRALDRKNRNEGTVIDIKPLISVEFDHFINGHTANGKGKDGHCWYYWSEHLELIEPEENFEIKWWKDGKLFKENNNQVHFEIGDKVEIKNDYELEQLRGLRGKVIIINWYVGRIGVEFDINILDKYKIRGHSCDLDGKEYGKWGHCRWFYPSELILLEPEENFEIKWWENGKLVKENNNQVHFEISDRVRINDNQLSDYYNLEGNIISINYGVFIVGVQFDNPIIQGHDCGGRGKYGHCRYFNMHSIVKIDSENDSPDTEIKWWVDGKLVNESKLDTFEAGDIVKVSDSYYLEKLNGLEGKVIFVHGDEIGVEFNINILDKYNIRGHSCHGLGKIGHCRFFSSDEVELIDSEENFEIKW